MYSFSPAENRDAAWRDTGYPGRFGIATIGRIRPEKGTDIFIEAMIRLLPDFPDVSALVIGKATAQHRSFVAELRRRVEVAGLSQRIVFTDEIAADRLPRLVRGLSILVAAPRYEGYGMTPLEAMASAVPIVASNTGFFSSFIGEDRAGTLVANPDAGEIAGAVRGLLQNPMELALKAGNARHRAEDLFGIDSEVEGIHKVYEALWERG